MNKTVDKEIIKIYISDQGGEMRLATCPQIKESTKQNILSSMSNQELIDYFRKIYCEENHIELSG